MKTETHICKECGIEFQALLNNIKKGYGEYCSRECAGIVGRRKRWNNRGITMATRICEECGIEFQIPLTYVKRGGGRFHSQSCVAINSARKHGLHTGRSTEETSRAYREANHDKIASAQRRYNYGLSAIDHYIMLEQQGYQCKICGDWLRNPMDNKRVHIDHIKGTKTVRGILCFDCNLMLGHAKDNQIILQKAAEYLHNY